MPAKKKPAKKAAKKAAPAKKASSRPAPSSAPVWQKMQLKPDLTLLVVNPPSELAQMMGALPSGMRVIGKASSEIEGGLVFVKDSGELARELPGVLPVVTKKTVFWIAYPKLTGGEKSDLTRDVLWKLVAKEGLRPARQIAVDDTWSAMRFVKE
jgi:hypothetical protein